MAFRGYLCTTPSHIPSRLKLRCICSSFAGDLWKGVLTIDACYFPQKLRACPLPTEMTNMGFNKSYDSCVPKRLNGTNRSRAVLRNSWCLLYLGVFTVYSICFQSFGNILCDRWSGHTTVHLQHGRFGMWALFWWVYKTWQVKTVIDAEKIWVSFGLCEIKKKKKKKNTCFVDTVCDWQILYRFPDLGMGYFFDQEHPREKSRVKW